MKNILLLIWLSVFSVSGFAQGLGLHAINVKYNTGYPVCDYEVSVSAEIKNPSTGGWAMTTNVTHTLIPGQTQKFIFSFPPGYYATGRYMFFLQPDNGGVCGILVDYTSSTPPAGTYGCSCDGSGYSSITYWRKVSASNFEFGTSHLDGDG